MSSSLMAGPSSGSAPVSPTAPRPQARKRTKTGCLTCRRRRIKCGEERPTCANCIKSKRQCEGYNQEFKWSHRNYAGVMTSMQYHNSMLPGSRQAYSNTQSSPQTSEFQHAAAPYSYSGVGAAPIPTEPINPRPGLPGAPYANDPSYHPQQPLHTPHSEVPTPTSATIPYQASPSHANFPAQYGHGVSLSYSPQQPYAHSSHYQQVPVSQPGSAYNDSQRGEYERYSGQTPRYDSNPSAHIHVDSSQGGQYPYYAATASTLAPPQIPQHDTSSDVNFLPQHAPVIESTAIVAPVQDQLQPNLSLSGFGGIDHASPTQVLDEAAVECEDDDYYDVQSDEEMPDEPDDGIGTGVQDFSLIQRIHRESTSDSDIRRFDSFIYEGILTSYRPEQVASPLKNPKTARVFMHFIHVTGPTLSIYERNPRNAALLYGGQVPPPPSHQSLWTYTMPQQALNNQGLLHAMLALSSVHIAKLQKASVTPSWKHYAYSLKRLGRALTNPNKRLQIPTLATALLLAFYEVMTAEHVKWSTHLAGATQLITELNFRALTQQMRQVKAAQAAEEQKMRHLQQNMLIGQQQLEKELNDSLVPDANLVSTIVGYKVSYDDFGVILDEGHTRKKTESPKFDLHSFETLEDLYWWHCRQDMIQSIVSGNPLAMPYRKWSDCPPRAPFGRVDALYGSHDHIILLIARIADFIVRDRERKLKQVEANGGQWIPTPGVPGLGAMGPPPSQSQGQRGPPVKSSASMGPPSHMQGMGPPPGWTGPPPPGWRGGPPPSSGSQGPPSTTQGPPPGWTGPPPPGWKGPPPPGWQGPPPSSGAPAQSPNFPGPPNQSHGPMSQPPRCPPPSAAGPGFYGMAPSRPPGPLPSSYANPSRSASSSSPGSPGDSLQQFSDLNAAYQAALEEWNGISHAHATMASLLSSNPAFAPLSADLYPTSTPTGAPAATTPFGPALIYGSYDISILWTLLHLAQVLLLRSHPGMPPAAMVAAAVGAAATQPYAMLIGKIAASLPLPTSPPGAGIDQPPPPLTPALGAAHIESCVSLFFAGVQYQDPAQREWLITRLLEIDKRTGWASADVIARSCETAWEKAGDAGRGPPYNRRTRRFGEEERATKKGKGKGEGEGRSSDGKSQAGAASGNSGGGEQQQHAHGQQASSSDTFTHLRNAEKWNEGERRYVVRHRAGFVPWAMNILADERDIRIRMESVGLEDREEKGEGDDEGQSGQ